MVAIVNNFWGAETGGLEEVTSFSGSSVASATQVRSGSYSYYISNGDIVLNPFSDLASAGSGRICGFAVWTPTVTPSGNVSLFRATQNTTQNGPYIVLRDIGELWLLDQGGSGVFSETCASIGFVANAWNYIELFWQETDSGAWALIVNDKVVGAGTGVDFLTASGLSTHIRFSAVTPDAYYVDDVYYISGCNAASDRLYPAGVYSYRSNLNSATPDTGSVLNIGTWLDVQTIPFDAGIGAEYTDAGSGAVYTDDVGGSANTGGPLTDENVRLGSIEAVKGIWRMERSTGGTSLHYGILGTNGTNQRTRTRALSPPTSAANYTHVNNYAPWLLHNYAPNGITKTGMGAYGITFSSDGRYFYRGDGGATIYQYELSRPWDISSMGSSIASIAHQSLVITNWAEVGGNPMGLGFTADGTYLYVTDQENDYFYEYSLSTPWNLSTATMNVTNRLLAQDSLSYAGCLSSDDTYYYGGGSDNRIHKYTFGTPKNIATLSFTASSPVVASTYVRSTWVNSDGTEIWWTMDDSPVRTLNRGIMVTPHDIANVTNITSVVIVNAECTFLHPKGAKIYLGERGGTLQEWERGITVPKLTQYAAIGFETTGAQDFECYNMLATVLRVPAKSLVSKHTFQYVPQLVR